MKVISTIDPYDSKGLMKAAIRDDNPICFMESESYYGLQGEVPEEEYYLPIGKANIVKEGTDVTIVTFGKMLSRVVMPAIEDLNKEGINAEVIDLRTIRPIDYETVINSVKKTNRMVFVEEAWPLGSIATEVTFKVQKDAFDYLDAPVLRVTCADVPLPYAPTLIKEALPNPERVVAAVKSVLYKEA